MCAKKLESEHRRGLIERSLGIFEILGLNLFVFLMAGIRVWGNSGHCNGSVCVLKTHGFGIKSKSGEEGMCKSWKGDKVNARSRNWVK